MLLSIIFLPFVNMLLCILFGNLIGYQGVKHLSIGFLSVAIFFSFWLFFTVALRGETLSIVFWDWFHSGPFFLKWGFLYDSLTAIMFLVVLFISWLVHIYSLDYMAGDPHLPRFMSYLSLFTFFMLILVSADNFVQLFLGWEGVGLCSYLLISFWFTRIQANKAAIKALIVNRLGDLAIVFALSLIFVFYQTLNYAVVFALTPHLALEAQLSFGSFQCAAVDVICFFLFLGAVGKSAQIGLHTWLPDAMEGPTPVSALIHAATMVTAGVFLIIRCSPLFEYAPAILLLLLFFGALTCFFAATIGLVQHDLKKVIAYSTCSQLGYMVFVCGFSNYMFSLYHLTTHACFKALLFLCAGSVIHALMDEQDIRKMGGLRLVLPVTYTCMLIGSFALIGFPFLAGFYSKDLIIESAASSYLFGSTFVYWLSSLAAIFTTIYSTRLLFFTFLGKSNSSREIVQQVKESSFLLLFPLIVLSFLSIFIGFFLQEIFSGMGTTFFGQALFIRPDHYIIAEMEFLPWKIKVLPIITSVLGFFLTLLCYNFFLGILYGWKLAGYRLFFFLSKKWYFDVVYNKFFVAPLFFFSYQYVYRIIDKGLLEMFGPFGFKLFLTKFSRQSVHIQTGIYYHYICFILFFISFVFIYL